MAPVINLMDALRASLAKKGEAAQPAAEDKSTNRSADTSAGKPKDKPAEKPKTRTAAKRQKAS